MSRLKPIRKYKVKHIRSSDVYAHNRELMQTYGLRNVTVIAKFNAYVTKSRIIHKAYDADHPCYTAHLQKLRKKGVCTEQDSLLTLSIVNFLNRTLQYLVAQHKHVTISAARQIIYSKKIKLNSVVYNKPTYVVSLQEEQSLFEDQAQNIV